MNETINVETTEEVTPETTVVDAETTIPQGIRNITPGQFIAMLNRAVARDKQRNKNRAKNKVARAQRNLNRRNNKGNH